MLDRKYRLLDNTAIIPKNIFQCESWLMPDIRIHITSELQVPCVHPTGCTLITSIHIGYVMRSNPLRNAPILRRGLTKGTVYLQKHSDFSGKISDFFSHEQ